MSMILMVKAMTLKLGNPLRKLVLIKLCDQANDRGECWPSHSSIADACEISKRSVITHIEALEQAGILKIKHRKVDNAKTSNLYTICLDNVDLGSATAAPGSAGDSLGVVQEIYQGSAGDSLGVVQEIYQGSAGAAHKSVNESVNKDIHGKKSKSKTDLTFSQWAIQCKENGETLLPADSGVFAYARTIGLPEEYLRLGWETFKRDHLISDKKQKDWRLTFLVYVRKGYLKLWYIDQQDVYQLTQAGKQAMMELAA